MDPTTAFGIVLVFGLVAFLYASGRHLADADTTNSPSLPASFAGAVITAALLIVLLV